MMHIDENQYLYLIRACVYKHYAFIPGYPAEDLYHLGFMGLRYGIKRLDPSKLNTMTVETYLYNAVRNKIGAYLTAERKKLKNKAPKNISFEKFYSEGKRHAVSGVCITSMPIRNETEFHERKPTQYDYAEMRVDVQSVLSNGLLTDKEKRVMRDTLDGMNQTEIGNALQITRERVRQIYNSAVAKIKRKMSR